MTDTIKNLGILGAGTMGTGIMINSVMHGIDVVLCDRNPEVLEAARNRLESYLARQIQKGGLTAPDVARVAKRLQTTERTGAFADRDLIIEAVYENLDLKQKIFAELEAIVAPTTILASNTSCLRLADISVNLKHKSRFCGMHYFSPAEINPVVELIEGHGTSPEVLSTVARFLNATGKETIACKDQNGFALNRFFCPYTNEAVRLLDDGIATTGQIDTVAKGEFGLALGPFAVMNIVGTATNLNAVRNLEPLGTFYAPADGLIASGEENAAWEIEDTPLPLDSAVRQTIADRLTGAILLPVLEELDEGVTSLKDIDKGAALAFRFQKTPGLLLQELGSEKTQMLIKQLTNPKAPA